MLSPNNYLQLLTIGQYAADGNTYISGTDPSRSVTPILIKDSQSTLTDMGVIYGPVITERLEYAGMGNDAAIKQSDAARRKMLEDYQNNPIAAAAKYFPNGGTPPFVEENSGTRPPAPAESIIQAARRNLGIAIDTAKDIGNKPSQLLGGARGEDFLYNGVIIVVAILLLGVAAVSIILPKSGNIATLARTFA